MTGAMYREIIDNLNEKIDNLNGKIFELNTTILEKTNEINNLKLENGVLWSVIKDTMYMAIRYANGCHTFAPHIVRDAIKQLKNIDPKFKLKYDDVIQPPTDEDIEKSIAIRDDWLDDLFKDVEK